MSALCADRAYRGRLLFAPGDRPCIALRLKKGEDVLKWGSKLVEDYSKT